MQFCYLLRKCGLLAHTSAAFLKNCCTEKLFVCLRLGSYNQYKNPTHPHHSSADESGSSFYQSEIRSKCLAHNHFNRVNATVKYRQNISFNLLTINGNRLNTLADVLRVFDCDFISVATELSGNSETIPFVRNRRVNLQTVPIRNNTQNVLRNCNKVPCCCTSQPAVLCFAVPLCILTSNHLCVYIRFGSMQVGVLFFSVSRSNLAVVFKCLVAVADKCFCTAAPIWAMLRQDGWAFGSRQQTAASTLHTP